MTQRASVWTGRARAILMASLMGGAGNSVAADLCSTADCSVSLQFASGGSLSASQGATLAFSAGGSLSLGSGGSMSLGNGGSITPEPEEGQSPDMSSGGTVVLGPGGVIQFGSSGSLATGSSGSIVVADGGTFDVDGASLLAIAAGSTVRMGRITSHGRIQMTAEGSMRDGDSQSPFNFSMEDGNPDSSFTVDASGDLRWFDIQGEPTEIQLRAGGAIEFSDGGAHFPDGERSANGPASSCSGEDATIQYGSNGDTSSTTSGCGEMQVVFDGSTLPTAEIIGTGGRGGSPDPVQILLLAVLGLWRRRK